MKECFRCAKVIEYYEPAAPQLAKGVFGIDIISRGKNDNHPLIVLFSEDDGHYWETARFSHEWVDCLISLLTEAKKKYYCVIKSNQGVAKMNYIKRLENNISCSERNLEKGEEAIQDFRRFLQSDKFQGVDLDGDRKDWISTKDVEERLKLILDALRGLTD